MILKPLKIFIIVLTLFLSSGIYQKTWGKDIQVLVYADSNYAPYSYEDTGKPAGIYYEILSRLFERMDGYSVSVKTVSWKYGLNMIKSGKGFAIYPPYRHLIKRPYIMPYSLPIQEEKVVLYCRQHVLNNQPRNNWPMDYYGLTIGSNQGFALGSAGFNQALKSGHIKMKEYQSTDLSLLGLINGEIDCYFNDRLSILWELKKLKQAGKYIEDHHNKLVQGISISKEYGYLGFTARDKGKFHYKYDFLKKFNRELVKMRQSDEIENIVKNFFD